MAGAELREQKQQLRARFKSLRAAITGEEKARRDRMIAERLLSTLAYRNAHGLLLYSAKQDEVETAGLIDRILLEGKKVALPRCYSRGVMKFFEIQSRCELETGSFGLLEPRDGPDAVCSSDYEICVVPGLAFDRAGYRLGYGKGFYDRYLKEFSGTKIALCYEDFFMDALPAGRFDVAVDVLITECATRPAQKNRR